MKNLYVLLSFCAINIGFCLFFSQCKCEEEIPECPTTGITVSNNQELCAGATSLLSASGGDAYLWSTGATTASISVNPNENTAYTISVFYGEDCVALDTIQVNLIDCTPEFWIDLGEDRTVCLGVTEELFVSGNATAYQWSTGSIAQNISINPATTTTYSVTASDANGNTLVEQITINVESINLNAGVDQSICYGSSIDLNATGTGVFYQWNTGQIAQNITVNPASTTTYSVTTSNSNGCTTTDQVVVEVLSGTAYAGPNQTICLSNGTTLIATGGSFYQWSTGETTQSITVSPTSTNTYTVTTNNSNGCTAIDEVTVTVNNVSVNLGEDQTICLGETASIFADGTGTNYEWSTGAISQTFTAFPTATTTYSVTTSDDLGCTATDEINIIVEDCGG